MAYKLVQDRIPNRYNNEPTRGLSNRNHAHFFLFTQSRTNFSCFHASYKLFRFHAVKQIRKGFSRHHEHEIDLARITHGRRFTKSRNDIFITTHSRNRNGPFTQSRTPMGGLNNDVMISSSSLLRSYPSVGLVA